MRRESKAIQRLNKKLSKLQAEVKKQETDLSQLVYFEGNWVSKAQLQAVKEAKKIKQSIRHKRLCKR